MKEEEKKNKNNTILPLKDLITSLTQNYQNQGYVICMDRFCTTLSVAQELTDKGFGCIGAIMDNRLRLSENRKSKRKARTS